MPESVPLKPAPPLAKRLNRNALIVAGVLAGITALTAVVLVRPGREPERPRFTGPTAREELAAPSRPTFPHQPGPFPPAPANPRAPPPYRSAPAPRPQREVKRRWPAPG